ncbi:hypothetical protein EW408_22660, partial [Salmonella enterica subsp. enterica serovar Typhimurium]|nr:hypothetical protein [Salmonella enterica subsp. enterica serovar Typhimurium]
LCCLMALRLSGLRQRWLFVGWIRRLRRHPAIPHQGNSGGCHSSTSINTSSAASPPYSFGA